ncbi:uncharacterized protein LOC131323811 [Rhododendron vialii]|uniref:uncharacterized protein LOC131323811 n=1 Tax=Rhododendron vialii TaxID=182163 RepID=UPI00265FD730|nr:uncharacterized protein LOC131323811 [Rhododendron vialii]
MKELEGIREHSEDSGLSRSDSRGNGYAMVKYRKAPSRGRRSRSRSPIPRRHKASPRKERSKSKSRTPERMRVSPRRKRSRGRSSTLEEEGTRKHHRDRLPVRGELRKSLNMSPVRTLAKLMELIKQHSRNEDDIFREDGKFPESNGIEKIRGNQKVAQQCLVSIVKKIQNAHHVHTVEAPDQPTIEDVGKDPTKRVIEGLKKIQINKTDP